MPTHKDVINETRKICSAQKSRICAISIMSFLIKFTAYFSILTAQFMCAQAFGSAFINGIYSIIFYLLYIAAFVFIHLPLDTGVKACYSNLAMGNSVRTDDIFKYFKNIKQVIDCRGPVAIKIALTAALWYAIGRVVAFVLGLGGFAVFSAVGIFSMVTIAVLAVLCAVAVMISYSPVTYIMVKTPSARPRKIIKTAEKITRNHRADILALYLRNWYRFALCVITLGVMCIWEAPFINILNKTYIKTLHN